MPNDQNSNAAKANNQKPLTGQNDGGPHINSAAEFNKAMAQRVASDKATSAARHGHFERQMQSLNNMSKKGNK